MTEALPAPFEFKDCALITLATGRSAHGLRDLRDHAASVPLDSLRHHFYEALLRPSFDDPEFGNDFAIWVHDALRDEVLAERLSALDPVDYADGEGLRTALVEVLEDRLAEVSAPTVAPAGHDFHFLSSQVVVFGTGRQARTPEELAGMVPRLSFGSVFFHLVEARLRPPRGVDDFSAWLEGWGERGGAARRALAGIDPMFGSLGGLRD
ncbi:MAG: DUF5752 family protein, partial [Thermoanaerobaculia bacterium]|nr:DUF5752 family protein [Thermoanaerobaculia bacterium]